MVRDEADIIGATVAHMLTQVDHVIVADNLSADETPTILAEMADGCDRLTVLTDHEPAHDQSGKMTRLAHRARDMGAEWVVPFDADEAWYSPFGRIADVLAGLGGYAVARATLYDHVPTAADPEGDPLASIGWRRRYPTPLPKVACRARADLVIEDGNHGAHYGAFRANEVTGQLIVRHYPYRTADQMTRKAVNGSAALWAAGRPRDVGRHWHDYADLEAARPGAIGEVFREHFWSADPESDESLIFDPLASCLS